MDVFVLLVPVGGGYVVRDVFATPELAMADIKSDWVEIDDGIWLGYVEGASAPWRIEQCSVKGLEDELG